MEYNNNNDIKIQSKDAAIDRSQRFIFVSFAGENREMARKISFNLIKIFNPIGSLGSEIFFDEEAIGAGSDWEYIYKEAPYYLLGLILLDKHFLRKEAPVRELLTLIEANTPLLIVFMEPLNELQNTQDLNPKLKQFFNDLSSTSTSTIKKYIKCISISTPDLDQQIQINSKQLLVEFLKDSFDDVLKSKFPIQDMEKLTNGLQMLEFLKPTFDLIHIRQKLSRLDIKHPRSDISQAIRNTNSYIQLSKEVSNLIQDPELKEIETLLTPVTTPTELKHLIDYCNSIINSENARLVLRLYLNNTKIFIDLFQLTMKRNFRLLELRNRSIRVEQFKHCNLFLNLLDDVEISTLEESNKNTTNNNSNNPDKFKDIVVFVCQSDVDGEFSKELVSFLSLMQYISIIRLQHPSFLKQHLIPSTTPSTIQIGLLLISKNSQISLMNEWAKELKNFQTLLRSFIVFDSESTVSKINSQKVNDEMTWFINRRGIVFEKNNSTLSIEFMKRFINDAIIENRVSNLAEKFTAAEHFQEVSNFLNEWNALKLTVETSLSNEHLQVPKSRRLPDGFLEKLQSTMLKVKDKVQTQLLALNEKYHAVAAQFGRRIDQIAQDKTLSQLEKEEKISQIGSEIESTQKELFICAELTSTLINAFSVFNQLEKTKH